MSPADLTDETLGRRALSGDRDAFTELFSRHEGGLFNVAYRLTGSREDAADITQEAFLRVFARLDDLGGREVNLPAYLHRTARNLVYDRGNRREAPTDLMELVAGADETIDADPELTALVGAQGADVRAANARLPERHRLVLALRELEDMNYEDIGRVLDVTPGAVGQLLARARLALRRELRLQHVDLEAMSAGCRARLGDIGALIDGELGADRSHVLSQHLELCPSCRSARDSFEQARVTYRAWLPLPILGLGASTARAAEGRRLVRFGHAGRRGAFARRGAGAGSAAGGLIGRPRRAWATVAAGVLGALLLFGAPTLVAVRSGSVPAPPDAPLAEVPSVATAVRAPTTPSTTAVAPAPAPAPPTSAAPALRASAGSTVAPPVTEPEVARRGRTTRVVPPPGRAVAPPPVTNAGEAVPPPPPPPVAPPVVPEPVDPPRPDPPPTRIPPTITTPPPTRTDIGPTGPPPTRTDPTPPNEF